MSKPQKKLSNHIICAHPHVTAEERSCYLKKAKVASPQDCKPHVVSLSMTIEKAFMLAKTPKPTVKPKIIFSPNKARLGKTHHYPRYCTTTNDLLVQFKTYLGTLEGASKGEAEASQVSTDVSKYLYFTNQDKIDPMAVLDTTKMNDYATQLMVDGVGKEGVTTKLDRIVQFIDYLITHHDIEAARGDKVCRKLKIWKKGLRKGRKGL